MRLFIINSLLFLFFATTLTLAAPVALPIHNGSISLYKSAPSTTDENAVISFSSSSTSTIPIPHTAAPGPGRLDDQASLVRRAPAPHLPPVWKDGLPGAHKTSGGIRCTGCAGKFRGIGSIFHNLVKITRARGGQTASHQVPKPVHQRV